MNGLETLFNIRRLYNDYDKDVLANESTDLNNQFRQLQNQRYGQETPLSLDKLRYENEASEIKNRIERGTEAGTISEKNSTNALKVDQNKTKQSIERNNQLIEAYVTGGKPELFRRAKELNVSKEFFDNIINAPNVGEALTKNRLDLMNRLSITPETQGKEQAAQVEQLYHQQLEKQKHEQKMKELELMNQGRLDVKTAGGSNSGPKPPTTAEGARVQQITAAVANGEMTPDQAAMEYAAMFNRKTDTKVPPGVMIPPGNGLVAKPQSAPYVPGSSQPTPPQTQQRTVVRTGKDKNTGQKVIQYSDGTIERQ